MIGTVDSYCRKNDSVRIRANLSFLERMLCYRLTRQDTRCPYCNKSNTTIIGKKHFVLQLRKCADCALMFRWPKDTPGFNHFFYQDQYRENVVTELPDEASLAVMKESIFRGADKDIIDKIDILKQLVSGGRVMDYGCSWGYGTFQLVAAGYEAIGFEISRPRAAFGRTRLGVEILSSEAQLDGLAGSFDAVFASHVLEHLPAPSVVFNRLARLLKPNGWLLGFVPNCGGDDARRLGVNWGPMCCEKHPLALDAEFLTRALTKHGFRVSVFSNPYDLDVTYEALLQSRRVHNLKGEELMICARKIRGHNDADVSAEGSTGSGR